MEYIKTNQIYRIESRMFYIGPTILDEIANSAFWLGLMMFFKKSEIFNFPETMEFDDARSTFLFCYTTRWVYF